MDRNRAMALRISNAAKPDEADILVYDVIGDPWSGGCTAADVLRDLRSLDATVKRINLFVNSEGGYVDDALAIYNALLEHPATVVANVVNAYSAASFVAMAADERLLAKTGKFMVHDALMFAYGNAADFQAVAERLDSESENIASIYAERAGGEQSEWRQRMQANGRNGTEYRGQAAVDIGLAHGLTQPRNQVDERIAALMPRPAGREAVAAAEPVNDPINFTGVGAAMEAARLQRAEPTLEQLIQTQPVRFADLRKGA